MDGRERVHVAGGNVNGSGNVSNSGIPLRTAFGRDEPRREEVIERPDSLTANKRDGYGKAFLKLHNSPDTSGSCRVVGYDGWRVGQLVPVTSTALGLSAYQMEIKQVDTDVGMGSGILSYDLQFNKKKWSGSRRIARGLPRKR